MGGTTYGVCLAPFEGAAIDVFEYVSGVEVRDFSGLSAEWSRVPALLERYGESFDPMTGLGDIEVRIPIQA